MFQEVSFDFPVGLLRLQPSCLSGHFTLPSCVCDDIGWWSGQPAVEAQSDRFANICNRQEHYGSHPLPQCHWIPHVPGRLYASRHLCSCELPQPFQP